MDEGDLEIDGTVLRLNGVRGGVGWSCAGGSGGEAAMLAPAHRDSDVSGVRVARMGRWWRSSAPDFKLER